MSDRHKPWTDEECAAFNESQQRADRHPLTCGNDSRHAVLIAVPKGYMCPDCDYRQNWNHDDARQAMTDDDLDALRAQAVWLAPAGCAQSRRVLALIAEVNRLRRQLDRIRDLTGMVIHTDPDACVGCGCMEMDAEEAVIDLMRDYERARALNLGEG